MASDATKQTISQSLNDLKAEVADRTRAIITGVKIPELESTLLISPTDQVIVETNSGTKRVSLKTIGNVFGGGGGFDLSDYQTKHDITLNTTDKTIVGAINELNNALTEINVKVEELAEKIANCNCGGTTTSFGLVTRNGDDLVTKAGDRLTYR